MPTKKRRVGFIPRNDVLDMITKLSYESNLSISKIINILVEEALYKRGIFDLNNGKVLNYSSENKLNNENCIMVKNDDNNVSSKFNDIKNYDNQLIKESSDEFIDKEIYAKFLMFLQFQEKMKKKN
tara:strand:+ start:43 stop:420 length:378 start_codon:yes stop_codon:yes gene_type:complete